MTRYVIHALQRISVVQSDIAPLPAIQSELEAELMRAVSDFGHEELNQLIDAAEAIRRTRRL